MIRTDEEWLKICDRIKAGYTPNGNLRDVFLTRGILTERLYHWYRNELSWKTIVDLGCGNGRLPMGLVSDGHTKVDYHGLDVILPCVNFCIGAFAPWKHNFKFQHLNVKNDHYWSIGKSEPTSKRLPFFDDQVDLFWANSLFTHQGKPEVVLHYLHEACRIMKSGAMIIATWRVAANEAEISYEPKQSIYLNETILDFYDSSGLEFIGARDCSTTPQVEYVGIKR